jgi:hypothetical protein
VAGFFSSPHMIDLIVGFTILEAILLILARRLRGFRLGVRLPGHDGKIRPITIVLMLLPGLCLMLAIRAALDGAAWPWVPAALAAALVAHVADVRERWKGC